MRRRTSAPIGALAALTAAWLGASPARAELVREMAASAFLDTIGVNTHLSAPDTRPDGTSYGNVDVVIRQLRTIGVKHVRDILLIGDNLPRLRLVNQQLGIKFVLVYDDYSPASGLATLRRALANVQSEAGIIEAIEGPNEPDQFGIHYDGLTGGLAVMKAQADLYRAVKDNKALAAIPVYCPSLSYPAPGGLADKLGDMSTFCDVATSHDYVENHSLGPFLPLDYLRRWTSFADKFAPGLPHVITEGGWSTNAKDAEGVDEITQAKYTLMYLLDAALLGIRRTYLYDLTDDGNDPQYTNNINHYGLFRYDGTAKPAATMLARVRKILAGDGPAPAGELAYTVSNLPPTGHQLLLRKDGGGFVLALWNDVLLWDRRTHAPMPRSPITADIKFETPVAAVQLIDPLIDRAPADLKLNGGIASVALTDHPVFIAIKPK